MKTVTERARQLRIADKAADLEAHGTTASEARVKATGIIDAELRAHERLLKHHRNPKVGMGLHIWRDVHGKMIYEAAIKALVEMEAEQCS